MNGKYKNIYPSTLATWAAIKYGCEHNFLYLDLMGAGKPDKKYGVRKFKAEFGGVQVEYGRFLFVTNPLLYALGKNAVCFMKKYS